MRFDQLDYWHRKHTTTALVTDRPTTTQKAPVYLKALTLRDVTDVQAVKEDIKKHMIVILKVTPLAQKDVEELRKVVEEMYSYAQSIGGDIARLGEERIVITPPGVKIWRGAYDLK